MVFLAVQVSQIKSSLRSGLAEALEKGMGHQLDFAQYADGNMGLNTYCMPVVVELQAIAWHPGPTRMHSEKFCFEAPPGFEGVLPGVVIKSVFINTPMLENFQQHSHIRPEFADPYKVRVCGQNSSKLQSGTLYQATCGRILYANSKYKISNTGIWYCEACAQFRVNGSYTLKYRID